MLLVGALVLWAILTAIFNARAEDRSVLVLMPEGVVECYHDKVKGSPVSPLSVLEQIEVENGKVTANSRCITAEFLWAGGEQTKWAIHNCYGDSVATAEKHHGRFPALPRGNV